jgi:hypothetical protein
MRARAWALTAIAGLTTALLPTADGEPALARAAGSPTIAVSGSSWLYPAFDPTIMRYAVHPASDGTIQVDVADAEAVRFNGVADADGSATFTDAQPGDEISVFIDDGTGPRAYALYVLPASFPKLSASATGSALQPGNIALTMDRYDGVSPRYEAILDRHGVPVYTREHRERVLDLKLARSGEFTLHRPTTTPGRTGGALVVLDDQFHETRRIETTGLVSTDDHDSVLESDGSRWLTAYEPNAQTGLVDSVIQHVTADGTVDFQWSSAPYDDETVAPGNTDYAHINSIDVQPNGDVLASFRHLSSVFLIASRPHDGYQPGDVIWKLGGRESDFTFPPGDGGPCAQHSASLLPNGNVLIFDNGSTLYFGNLCIDPADPTRPAVQRPMTRVVEFALAGTAANPVRTYGPADRFAWFMGSAARLSNGNVLIGWSADQTAITYETDASGSTLWSLADERISEGGAYFSYRAALVPERDGFDPQVILDGPPDGVTVTQGADVPVSYSCEDRGGSTLQTCDGPVGQRLDTTDVGQHTWQVAARDGSGRQITVTRGHTVAAAPAPSTAPTGTPTPTPTSTPTLAVLPTPVGGPRPDLAVRTVRRSWVGAGEYAPTAQTAMLHFRRSNRVRVFRIRVTNTGPTTGRFRLRGPITLGRGAVDVSYRSRGESRTRAMARGWRTPALAPGTSLRLRVRVTVRRTSSDNWSLPVRATGGGLSDRVVVTLRR